MTTLIADPDVTAIPVVDNGEPLVDLCSLGVRCAGASHAGRFVRDGLAIRLAAADAALRWVGARLVVVEGHRLPAEQERIFTEHVDELRRGHPEATEAELARRATRFVAPLRVAPHIAGAAVDLTLTDAHGRRLWMGTPIDATPEQSDNACYFDAADIDDIARANRSLLKSVLAEAGLVNYPTEWWHWSYGDRYWAFANRRAHAVYGPIEAAA